MLIAEGLEEDATHSDRCAALTLKCAKKSIDVQLDLQGTCLAICNHLTEQNELLRKVMQIWHTPKQNSTRPDSPHTPNCAYSCHITVTRLTCVRQESRLQMQSVLGSSAMQNPSLDHLSHGATADPWLDPVTQVLQLI